MDYARYLLAVLYGGEKLNLELLKISGLSPEDHARVLIAYYQGYPL